MADLAARLRARIEADGPIPFDQWMEACLYDPQDGYYMRPGRKTGPGVDADFATSPTLHPFLGTCVAREIEAAWEGGAGRPDCRVIEFGGGEGHLARAALAYLGDRGIDAHWTHIETSPTHRAAQAGDHRLAWAEEVPGSPWAFVVAHEFVDALPLHLLERRKGGWAEVCVTLEADGFVASHRIPEPTLLAAAPPAGPFPGGQRLPLALRARDWLASLGPVAAGRLLVIDYGGPGAWQRALDGTIRTFLAHQDAGSPLEDPGGKDITANVDTDMLEKWAAGHGWRQTGLQSQEGWLLDHGILDALNQIPRDTQEHASDYLRLRQMLLPTGMGRAFFVQKFTK